MIKKILISQPKPAADKSPYFDIEKKHEVQLTFHQLVRIEGISPTEFRQQKIQILDHTAIVFTSRHAIDHFFTLCKEMRVTLPEDMKYFGVSENVVLYIQKYVQYRKRKVFFGPTGRWQEMIDVMMKHKNENYFIPQSDVRSDDFHKALEERGLQHTEGVMYRTVSNPLPDGKPFDFDLVMLFTPSGVKAVKESYPDAVANGTRLACLGAGTAKAIEENGWDVTFQAPMPGAPSTPASLDAFLTQNNG